MEWLSCEEVGPRSDEMHFVSAVAQIAHIVQFDQKHRFYKYYTHFVGLWYV